MEMDNLQEPLISNRDPEDDREDTIDDGLHDVDAPSPANPRLAEGSSPGLFMWLLTFSAGISGLLFGCTVVHSSPLGPHRPLEPALPWTFCLLACFLATQMTQA